MLADLTIFLWLTLGLELGWFALFCGFMASLMPEVFGEHIVGTQCKLQSRDNLAVTTFMFETHLDQNVSQKRSLLIS